MEKGNRDDVCRICGNKADMSNEHIPPKSSGNNKPLKVYKGHQLLGNIDKDLWNYEGIEYENMQKGRVFTTLCIKCNNYNGIWYVPHYSQFVKAIKDGFSKNHLSPGSLGIVEIKEVRSLAVIKQIVSMFVTINPYGVFEKDVRSFIKDKESNSFPEEKYSIYMYGFVGSMEKALPKAALLLTGKISVISEIATVPVGFTLSFGQNNERIIGCNITHMTRCNYADLNDIEINLPILQSHTVLPLDYRSKRDILKQIR